jgi:predicted GIY-YIG superfamily endonuclease
LIPTETIGYVYIIISKCDTNFTYIGESLNISQRLSIHNSGHGAVDTACITRCPYALAGLISCVGLEKNIRLALEQNWRVLQEQSISRNDTPYSIIRLGELVAQYNNQILLNTGNMQQCVWQCFLEDDA